MADVHLAAAKHSWSQTRRRARLSGRPERPKMGRRPTNSYVPDMPMDPTWPLTFRRKS